MYGTYLRRSTCVSCELRRRSRRAKYAERPNEEIVREWNVSNRNRKETDVTHERGYTLAAFERVCGGGDKERVCDGSGMKKTVK